MENKKLKGFAKDTLIYGIGDGLGRISGFVLLPILSRIFVPLEYGIIDFLNVSYAFILMFLGMNVLTGIQKFYYLTSDEERRSLMLSVICGLVIIVVFMASMAVYFSTHISKAVFDTTIYSDSIILLALCLPVETIFQVFILLLRLNRKAIQFSIYSALSVVITILLTYYFVVVVGTGIKGVFIAKFANLLVLSCLLIFYLKNEFSTNFQLKKFKKIVLFSLPGLPAVLITSLMNALPLYVLKYYSSFTIIGLYGVASRFSQIINMVTMSFNRAWNPFAFANSGKSDEVVLYEKIFKFYSSFLIFVVMAISLFAKNMIGVLTPEKYHSAYTIVGALCLYNGLRGLRPILSTALYSKNRVSFTSYLNILLLGLFIGLSALLVPKFQVNGLLAALLLSGTIQTALYIIISRKYIPFSVNFIKFLLQFLVAFFGVVCFEYIRLSGGYDVFGKIVFLNLYLLFLYFFILTNEEQSFLNKSIQMLMGRKV